MAARQGEDIAATLFADVHYYYGAPTTKPPHHRFDKGSYVYLFENAHQRRARIEIANNAGTPEQDAFTGYLDGAQIKYSYKHTNMVTVTVQGTPADDQDWHLPTFDPRNENKYMYKLHTIDIYFWAKDDALQFVNGTRRVLPYQQVTIQDEPVAPPPPPPHTEDMSPIVQNLENVAISDPSYQHGRTRDSRGTAPSFPGPPMSALPQSQEASNFAPMAYNPAAPAAPEAIAHREKTPPPEDGTANPLMAAASTDQGQAFGAPPYGQVGFSGPPTQQSYFPGPPAQSAPPSQFGQPPQAPAPGLQSPGLQSPYAQHFQNTFAPPPTAPSASPYAQPPPAPASAPVAAAAPPAYQQQPPSHIPVTQYANYPLSPGISRAMTTPGLYSPGFSSGATTPGIYSPGAPPGGFSQHQYTNNVSNTQPLSTDYSVHQQVYRPTEHEAAPKAGKAPKPPRGKLEARAGQLEKGMGSLFKKLEKKIG